MSLTILFNCEPAVDPVRTFVVKKGDHYANPRMVESLQSQTLIFQARFNSTAKYDLENASSQSNINKLFGFADCNSLHHDNSARFGWAWYHDRLEIYAYCYVNSQRKSQFIGVVNLNEYNRYEIQITNDNYIFKLNNETPYTVQRGNTCKEGLYYMLWPYFGGDAPAPHDVSVDIKMTSW
jgi:hypothetical protein